MTQVFSLKTQIAIIMKRIEIIIAALTALISLGYIFYCGIILEGWILTYVFLPYLLFPAALIVKETGLDKRISLAIEILALLILVVVIIYLSSPVF